MSAICLYKGLCLGGAVCAVTGLPIAVAGVGTTAGVGAALSGGGLGLMGLGSVMGCIHQCEMVSEARYIALTGQIELPSGLEMSAANVQRAAFPGNGIRLGSQV